MCNNNKCLTFRRTNEVEKHCHWNEENKYAESDKQIEKLSEKKTLWKLNDNSKNYYGSLCTRFVFDFNVRAHFKLDRVTCLRSQQYTARRVKRIRENDKINRWRLQIYAWRNFFFLYALLSLHFISLVHRIKPLCCRPAKSTI